MTTPDPAPGQTTPRPLTVAAAVAALEGLVYGVLGVWELAVLDADRPEVSVSTAIFFLLLAAFLGFSAWRLRALHHWARAPIVMVQLIQVPVAFSFWGSGWTKGVTIAMLALSAVVLVGVFHPRSLAALEEADA